MKGLRWNFHDYPQMIMSAGQLLIANGLTNSGRELLEIL